MRDEALLKLFFGDLLAEEELLGNIQARREWCERTLELFREIDELAVTGWGPRESPTEALHYGLELMEWMRDWYARKERELTARARRGRRAETKARRRPLSSAAIRPQSGWWPTTATSAPRSATTTRSASAVAPGASRSSASTSHPSERASSAAVSRARSSGLVSTTAGRAPLAASRVPSVAGGGPPCGRERAQVVRLPGRRLGVADEIDAHAARIESGRGPLSLRRLRRLHRHAADRQPARRLHRRARAARGATAAARARDELQRDGLRLPGRESRTRGSGSSRPAVEVPFAGHPTLGSAFVLAGPLQLDVITLETGSGVVPVRLEREGARIVFGRMEQPIPDGRAVRGRGRAARRARRRAGPSCRSSSTTTACRNVYVALASEEEVAALRPDLGRLAELPTRDRRQLLRRLGARAGRRGCSRPPAESPRIRRPGSAAGPLALHLARHGRIAFGDEIEITQGVEIGRPSKLYARVEGSAEQVECVEVGGSAVVVARGEFQL